MPQLKNVLSLRPPGMDKTHLATGLEITATQRSYRLLSGHRRRPRQHPDPITQPSKTSSAAQDTGKGVIKPAKNWVIHW